MTHLSDRTVLALSGADARSFLQGLITNDITLLTPEKPLYAAMLSPQGKYLFDFFLYEIDGKILLDVLASRADDLLKKLSLYKLRSDVQIASTELQIYVDFAQGLPDPRSTKLMRRIVTNQPLPTNASLHDYKLHLLQNGVPDSDDFIIDKSFVMHYRFEELHGVSFTKGCYIGQENTARMKHRGTTRKLIYIIEGTNLPEFGTEIDGLGTMLSSIGTIGLVLADIDLANSYQSPKFQLISPTF